ncbi:phytanoyl-CoA dioxygenase family protein [Acaryochloris sp. IP29b_bin.148]|uniref:phytanoyl-CoA dioxygenase family protein n=1 Tax=Acaryochloris sp. IP29b_bin.148 TaxID=2969218 RepID=UPI0026360CD2|nr:phytanoyl-CoA dioxygenase family protein [Acaryochloris sp. IP29b_bin.148]
MTIADSPLDQTAQAFYQENGYFLFRKLIPSDLIDVLLTHFQQSILPSRQPFFRQNTGYYERHIINEHGYMTKPLLDIHGYLTYPEFSQCALTIFCGGELQTALKSITGVEIHKLVQTMLFDSNTATPPHQDWWYTDSIPNGHLVGAWIALEEIAEAAGRFYVMPKTMTIDLHSHLSGENHAVWMAAMNDYFLAHRDEIFVPALKPGDVLMWNSRTIHGALPNQDPRCSRKSITAHYLPAGYQYGSLFTVRKFAEAQYKTFKDVPYFVSHPDYSYFNDLKYRTKRKLMEFPVGLKLLRRIRSIV